MKIAKIFIHLRWHICAWWGGIDVNIHTMRYFSSMDLFNIFMPNSPAYTDYVKQSITQNLSKQC